MPVSRMANGAPWGVPMDLAMPISNIPPTRPSESSSRLPGGLMKRETMAHRFFKLGLLALTVLIGWKVGAPQAWAQPAVSSEVFYDQLAPAGDWLYVSPYGQVWQPRGVGPDFRPYASSGHWVYTDYGWSFVSDYNWGWATFHYGRPGASCPRATSLNATSTTTLLRSIACIACLGSPPRIATRWSIRERTGTPARLLGTSPKKRAVRCMPSA